MFPRGVSKFNSSQSFQLPPKYCSRVFKNLQNLVRNDVLNLYLCQMTSFKLTYQHCSLTSITFHQENTHSYSSNCTSICSKVDRTSNTLQFTNPVTSMYSLLIQGPPMLYSLPIQRQD